MLSAHFISGPAVSVAPAQQETILNHAVAEGAEKLVITKRISQSKDAPEPSVIAEPAVCASARVLHPDVGILPRTRTLIGPSTMTDPKTEVREAAGVEGDRENLIGGSADDVAGSLMEAGGVEHLGGSGLRAPGHVETHAGRRDGPRDD
jgi:hypothetical protein